MKKILLLLGLVICSSLLFSLGTLRVESIKELPAEHMNLEVYDADGKYAPVLIVKTELKGLGIQNIGRPTKHAPEYNAQKNEYKFYMNDNQRVVEITHSKYQPLEVRLLADFGINVKAQRVYELTLANQPEKEFVNVVIISDPSDATKIIDGKDMGTGQSFELAIGKHTLKLQKDGYKNQTKDIEVTRRKTLFNNLTLPEQEPVMLTIKSEPTGADIYINNVLEGATNKQLFKFPDTYNLRLVKDKYDTVEETIMVTEDGSNNFNYTLRKNTSTLKIQTTPADCDIYLNNEKMSGNSKEVSAGEHKIKIIKSGYDDIEATVIVEKGIDKTEIFNLQKNTSILTINTTPANCDIYLNNEKLDGNSKEVSAGKYKVEVKKEGYYDNRLTVDVQKGQNKTVNISLKQKTGKLQFVVEPMEAQITLKQGNKTVETWTGSKYFSSLPVGSYTLTAGCDGYKSQNKQVVVNLDETTKIDIALKEGSDIPTEMVYVGAEMLSYEDYNKGLMLKTYYAQYPWEIEKLDKKRKEKLQNIYAKMAEFESQYPKGFKSADEPGTWQAGVKEFLSSPQPEISGKPQTEYRMGKSESEKQSETGDVDRGKGVSVSNKDSEREGGFWKNLWDTIKGGGEKGEVRGERGEGRREK